MGEKAGSVACGETCEGYIAPEASAMVPWLVKEYREFNKEDYRQTKTNYGFYDIFEQNKEDCKEFVPELSNTTFYHKPSHQGWLIVICDDEDFDYTPSGRNDGDCYLWNPMTKETIQLPRLPEFCEGIYRSLIDGVLTSPPRMHTNNINLDDDSIVFLFCYNSIHQNDHTFLFCRPGETQWRIHKLSPDLVDFISDRDHTVLCFKGKLYLMCSDEKQLDEHLDHHLEIEHFSKDTDLTISIKTLQVKKMFSPIMNKSIKIRGLKYFVSYYLESNHELFRVDIIHPRRSVEVISIGVMRLNFSSMEWEKVNSLGDYVLFFGDHTSACISAAELGLTRGCLYYCPRCERGVRKFEIQNTSYTITFPRKPFSCQDWVNCQDWVIMPVSEQRRVANMLGSMETETSTTMVVDTEMISKIQTTSFLSPWLLFPEDHSLAIFTVVNPTYNEENYSINISNLADCTIRFQKGGWLLVTKENIIFFYNPFTRDMVKLPDMDRAYCHSVVSFSSSPISSDCIVFAMDERTDQVFIDFIRKGEARWSSYVFNNAHDGYPFLETAFFHDGAFFCVDLLGAVGAFSVDDNSWKVLKKPRDRYFGDSPGFVVECGGDLLLVKLECDDLHEADQKYYDDWEGLKSVRIFRLNFSEMEWVKVENLGEHVLFLSNTSCVSAVALNNNMKKNIYFPRLHLDGGGVVFYSLKTGKYHSTRSQHSAKNLSNTKGWYRNCTWIEPNWLMYATEELDWIKTPSGSK